ncbi:MAG: hypothetical protein JJU28_09155 [Cyclobacteriaceae bacterium]|nr:hypothetical protein [Cyclobacteriaceae bacterium]
MLKVLIITLRKGYLTAILSALLFQAVAQSPIPPKGTVFNESEMLADSVTGRALLRLTQYRDFNQTPTYHIHTGFSADSKTMVFASWNTDGESALMQGNVETGDIKVIAVVPKEDHGHFNGNNICMVPATNMAAAVRGGKLYVYDLKTLEERMLLEAGDGFGLGHPTGSTDGKTLYVTKMPRYRRDIDDPYPAASSVYFAVDIESGKSKELFRDNSRNNHTIVCPTNPDLLLIDRDLPPRFGHGGDHGKTTRVWLLNIKTKELTEIRPLNPNRFQIHSNWSPDGKYVYYHGRSEHHTFPEGFSGRPHYIGVADQGGKVLWEQIFPNFSYGHISSHTTRNTIITDGLFFNNMISEIFWENINSQGIPDIHILGAHNSGSHTFGQHAHPHCIMSPNGRFLSYNRGTQYRSDVYILRTD